eukprot:CAMPEP_0203685960 /NCGR_PEP_ID=MMETSP0090-20130426/48818_1 /ASSEMBLY_ACC=CAM_ASM_001088 /TAXON_ID=426623 /ORGANISM="Chaetoceros affinis, Strain CCMP159" /LENGTH=126 /DNA_ID=CAMNT_0050555175 /DNA_START=99 /DNA_END=476 /DNA_ORIENTATION=+
MTIPEQGSDTDDILATHKGTNTKKKTPSPPSMHVVVYIVLIFLRAVTCAFPGYIHPDEFFQGGQELFYGCNGKSTSSSSTSGHEELAPIAVDSNAPSSDAPRWTSWLVRPPAALSSSSPSSLELPW